MLHSVRMDWGGAVAIGVLGRILKLWLCFLHPLPDMPHWAGDRGPLLKGRRLVSAVMNII